MNENEKQVKQEVKAGQKLEVGQPLYVSEPLRGRQWIALWIAMKDAFRKLVGG